MSRWLKEYGLTDKEALKAYMRSKDRDPEPVWQKMYDQIRRVMLDKAWKLQESLDKYSHSKGVRLHPRCTFSVSMSVSSKFSRNSL